MALNVCVRYQFSPDGRIRGCILERSDTCCFPRRLSSSRTCETALAVSCASRAVIKLRRVRVLSLYQNHFNISFIWQTLLSKVKYKYCM